MKLSPRQSLQARQQLLAIRLSDVLEMSEPDYRQWVLRLERDPVFQWLRGARPGGRRLLRRRPWMHGGLYARELFESLPEKEGSGGLPELSPEAVALIRRIGRENFEKYFLYNDGETGAAEAARACGIEPAEAEQLLRVTDELEIRRAPGTAGAPPPMPGVDLVAALETRGDKVVVSYMTSHYARGLYEIDYDALQGLKAAPSEAPVSWAKVRETVRRMELANRRQTVLAGLLDLLTKHQKRFIFNGRPTDMKALNQRQAASHLGVSPSAVSRALAGRAVKLPWGEERLLAEFYPSRRAVAMRWAGEALDEKPDMKDAELRRVLESQVGGRFSLRSVNMYRHAVLKGKGAGK